MWFTVTLETFLSGTPLALILSVTEPSDSPGTPMAKFRRSKLIVVAAVAVTLIASGWGAFQFFNRPSSDGANQTAGGSEVKAVLPLETFVVNLGGADEKAYLRVGIALGLNRELNDKASDRPTPIPLVRDAVLGVLSLGKPDELLLPEGKNKLKSELIRVLRERAPELGVREIYSTSQVDHRKVGKLSLAIQVAFQELGVFPASTTMIPVDSKDPLPFNTVQAIENAEHAAAMGRIAPPPKGKLSGSEENGDLSALRTEMEKALAPEISRQEVALRTVPDGLVISLREIGFFESGSANIRPNSQSAFSRIALLLSSTSYRIRIEGHTDNVPIHNQHFADNWALSTARSTELVRVLIVNYSFAPGRLSAAGYAEFHPATTNNTAEGRAQNRRVDVVILGR